MRNNLFPALLATVLLAACAIPTIQLTSLAESVNQPNQVIIYKAPV